MKSDLDSCFRLEKEVKRKQNLQKAREFDEKYEKMIGNSKS